MNVKNLVTPVATQIKKAVKPVLPTKGEAFYMQKASKVTLEGRPAANTIAKA